MRFFAALLTTSLAGVFIATSVHAQTDAQTDPSATTPPAQSSAHDFRIGPRGGPGELRVDEGQRIGDEVVDSRVSEDTISIGVTFEYKSPYWVVLEGGVLSSGSTDWFDSEEYRLFEYFGSIGVEIPLGRGFSLTPRVGRSRWKLESDEVWFFDEDDDAPTARGYQNYWEITGLKRINDTVALGVSHRDNHYDFGRVRTTMFTAMFSLR